MLTPETTDIRYKVYEIVDRKPAGEPVLYTLDIDEAMKEAQHQAETTGKGYGVVVINKSTHESKLFYQVS